MIGLSQISTTDTTYKAYQANTHIMFSKLHVE